MAYVHASQGTMEYEVPETTRRLVEWARREGAVFPKLEYPVRFEPGYIGAMAREEIGPDEVVLRVPERMWLSWDKADVPPLSGIYVAYPDVFDTDTARLYTLIAYELSKGVASYWDPFFQFLQTGIETLMHWTAEEMQELQDSALCNEVRTT